MVKEFELEAILTVTTGVSLVDDFEEVYKLVQFIYSDPFIGDNGFLWVKNDARMHIFSLYPELMSVVYPKISKLSTDDWLTMQKKIFGNTLSITRYGHPLLENELEQKLKIKK